MWKPSASPALATRLASPNIWIGILCTTAIILAVIWQSGLLAGSTPLIDEDSELSKSYLAPTNQQESNEPRPRVVASISTFPGRCEIMNDTIQSLVDQTYKLDKIYLQIPAKIARLEGVDASTLPAIVEQFKADHPDLLSVYRPEDYGPATKLLGTLLVEKDPETIIVTVDDDTVYHPEMVRGLVETLKRHPNHQPCYVCEVWPRFVLGPYHQEQEGVCHGWANAYAGVAYKAGWFDSDVFDFKDAPAGCKLHDDVYLSGYLYQKGKYPYIIKPDYNSLWYHKSWNNLSIHYVARGESDYRNPCLAHFNYLRV